MTSTTVEAAPSGARVAAPPTVRDIWTAATAAIIAAMFGIVAAIAGNHFFYVGDNPESFIPLWHHFGELLRSGQWWTVEASGWMGGNYVGEAAYAQWNPLLLLAYVVLSFFTDLSLGAAVIMITMMALLAAGAYLLMRSYGALPMPSLALSVALPVTGFTLFYEAAGWPMGLAALIGLTFFWVALRQQVTGRWPVFVTWIFGYLAVTTGNPYVIVFIVVLLAVFFIEALWHRGWRAAVDLFVAGLLTGVVAILVFIPFFGAQPVSQRQDLAAIANDTFMVPGIGDLVASGTSSYLPKITNWGFAHIELLPSSYLAWFAIPLLFWIRWGALWQVLRERATLLAMGGIFFLAILGPSNLWLFRWPIRLIEYFYLIVFVVLALGISVGLARTRVRARLWATGLSVAFGSYLAVMMTPGGAKLHAAGFALTLALLAAVFLLWKRYGSVPALSMVIVGTLLTTGFQAYVYPRAHNAVVPAYDLYTIREQAADYQGTVLQLASQSLTDAEQVASAKILYGNLFLATGHESINRYSGISFRDLGEALCLDYKGQTCPEAYDKLFQPVAHTEGTLADALGVDTLIIQRALIPEIADGPARDGWTEVERNDIRTVWVRATPIPKNGRVSGTSAGVQAQSTSATETAEDVRVSAEQAGYVTFARLAWPGYAVTLDGERVDAETTAEGLLQVAVPAGESTIHLAYVAPGLAVGGWASGAAGVLALAYSLLTFLLGRRRGRTTDATH